MRGGLNVYMLFDPAGSKNKRSDYTHKSITLDELNLHRRDYNLAPRPEARHPSRARLRRTAPARQ